MLCVLSRHITACTIKKIILIINLLLLYPVEDDDVFVYGWLELLIPSNKRIHFKHH
jgi:hypothetical protein